MATPQNPRPKNLTETPPLPRADLAVAAGAVILAAVALIASSLQSGFAPLITLTLTPPGIAPADGGMIIVVPPTPGLLPGIQMGAAIAVLMFFVAAMRLLLLVPAVRHRHATVTPRMPHPIATPGAGSSTRSWRVSARFW